MDINEPLQHYASPYYDPVKAHEYYMRTRELKGRRSTTKLNDEGKKVWAYTKNEISGEKKEKVKEEQEKRKQKIAELRAKAKATREQISAKLKERILSLPRNLRQEGVGLTPVKNLIWRILEKKQKTRKSVSMKRRILRSNA